MGSLVGAKIPREHLQVKGFVLRVVPKQCKIPRPQVEVPPPLLGCVVWYHPYSEGTKSVEEG